LKVFDLLVLLALLITAYGGLKNGFIQTVFKTIGYIAGGVAGVAIAVEVMSTWSNNFAKATVVIILILLLAMTGEFILGKIGSLFRKILFIPPFKFVDSFLGAVLSITRTVLIIYLLSVFLLLAPTNIGSKYISDSNFYTKTNSYLPKVITDLKVEAEQIFKQVN
jgi:uncharacterized membrane protein required for colicin V production